MNTPVTDEHSAVRVECEARVGSRNTMKLARAHFIEKKNIWNPNQVDEPSIQGQGRVEGRVWREGQSRVMPLLPQEDIDRIILQTLNMKLITSSSCTEQCNSFQPS